MAAGHIIKPGRPQVGNPCFTFQRTGEQNVDIFQDPLHHTSNLNLMVTVSFPPHKFVLVPELLLKGGRTESKALLWPLNGITFRTGFMKTGQKVLGSNRQHTDITPITYAHFPS
jgi:hypothetical protein